MSSSRDQISFTGVPGICLAIAIACCTKSLVVRRPKPPPSSILWIFFSSRRRHTSCSGDWSSDVCSSDLQTAAPSSSFLSLGTGRAGRGGTNRWCDGVRPPHHVVSYGAQTPLVEQVAMSVLPDFATEQIGRASCRERV